MSMNNPHNQQLFGLPCKRCGTLISKPICVKCGQDQNQPVPGQSGQQPIQQKQFQPPAQQQLAVNAPQTQPAYSGQKWEYAELNDRFGYREAPWITFCKPSGVKGHEFKRDKARGDKSDLDAMYRGISQLMSEGWRQISSSHWNGHRIIYFERPAQ